MIMLIGTSLGGCLKSIMDGEVSEDSVVCIITRTRCPEFERYINVVKQYYASGNPYSQNPERYEIYGNTLENVVELASRLWHSGKIHQPRVYSSNETYGRVSISNDLWLQIVPTNSNSTPAVVDAYEKYKMLDILTRV